MLANLIRDDGRADVAHAASISATSSMWSELLLALIVPLIDQDLTGAISPPTFGQGFTLDVPGEEGRLLGVVGG